MIPDPWREAVGKEIASGGHAGEVAALQSFLSGLSPESVVPDRPLWFASLDGLRPQDVTVIILGQDPHPTRAEETGCSFAVNRGADISQSLRNIMVVARSSVSVEKGVERAWPMDRTLQNWKRQGVLLLNARLTTLAGQPGAHTRKGWEHVTRAIMAVAARASSHCTAMLWGGDAQAEAKFLKANGAELLMAPHPSPLGWARGRRRESFRDSRCFYHVNVRRRMKGLPRIAWEVTAED